MWKFSNSIGLYGRSLENRKSADEKLNDEQNIGMYLVGQLLNDNIILNGSIYAWNCWVGWTHSLANITQSVFN